MDAEMRSLRLAPEAAACGRYYSSDVRRERPHNNEMQRTKHGLDGASPLISVLCVPYLEFT